MGWYYTSSPSLPISSQSHRGNRRQLGVFYTASHSNNQCMKIWQHDGVSASASHGGPRLCCPEAGCSDTGAGCGVVTSGWCTDGGCAGLLINTKYTRGRTWSLPTVTTLASALARWWYAGTLVVQVVHGTRPSSRTHCPAQTNSFCVVWWRNLDI